MVTLPLLIATVILTTPYNAHSRHYTTQGFTAYDDLPQEAVHPHVQSTADAPLCFRYLATDTRPDTLVATRPATVLRGPCFGTTMKKQETDQATDLRLVVDTLRTRLDTAKATIHVGYKVACALGRLDIAHFAHHKYTCPYMRRDSISIEVEPVLVRIDNAFRNESERFRTRNEDIGRSLEALLDLYRLRKPVRAFVRGNGITVADVSGDGDELFTNPKNGHLRVFPPQVVVTWASVPFGPLNLSGGLGQRAVLAVWSHKPETEDENLYVQHGNGFFSDLFLDARWVVGKPQRHVLGTSLGVGTEFVALETTLFNSLPVRLAENRVGSWSRRYEFKISYRAYQDDWIDIDYGAAPASPVIEIAAGLRNSQRFKQYGALAPIRNGKRFYNPGNRVFWRVAIDLGRVVLSKEAQDTSWSFMLVTEQVVDWPGDAIPTSTKLIFVGETDVLPLFGG